MTNPRIHCESFWDGGAPATCEIEQNKRLTDPAGQVQIWSARRFIFGIHHPDLCEHLCPTCLRHVRKLVGVPS